MKILPIASSSDGNATLITTRNTNILIDCGISLKALTELIGYHEITALDAVLITHEHGDHMRGVGPLGRRFRDLPVYMNEKSFRQKSSYLMGINHQLLDYNPLQIGDCTVQAIPACHDTANTFGFAIKVDQELSFCYLTDTGWIEDETASYLTDADVLFIESNYDEQRLEEFDGYSAWHKARIKETHLSNRQTLDLIENIGINTFKHIIMGHLSPRTNRPELVRAGFLARFPDRAQKLTIAPVKKPVLVEV